MGNYFFIQNIIGNVIDIQGASNTSGALLDAFAAKSTDNENQLWEFVPDPAGSGYFFIKNQNGNVIDIQGASNTSGAPLDAFSPKPAGTTEQNYNQLWLFMQDPAGSGCCFIVSKLNANVIDIQGGAVSTSGAPLDAFPLKPVDNQNQLWTVSEGVWGPLGAFPSTVPAVPAPSNGLGSNSNYKLYNDCNPLGTTTVVIDVTADICCLQVSGDDSALGFSFQLNCYSPKHEELAYQQFVLALIGNELQYNIQGGVASGAPLFDVGYSSLTSLPNSYLPAGYQLIISFSTQDSLVSRVSFIVKDDAGNTLADQTVLLSSIDGVPPPSVGSAPVVAFELNFVGPENEESAVLSTGAGTISYISDSNNLSPLPGLPSCVDTMGGTEETANTVYGVLPSHPNQFFKQYFYVS